MSDAPLHYPASTLPFGTAFEAGVSGHQFLQQGMQLVLCTQPQLKSIHKGDEALSRPSLCQFAVTKLAVGSSTDLRRFRYCLRSLGIPL
jgi:hypothetical protein